MEKNKIRKKVKRTLVWICADPLFRRQFEKQIAKDVAEGRIVNPDVFPLFGSGAHPANRDTCVRQVTFARDALTLLGVAIYNHQGCGWSLAYGYPKKSVDSHIIADLRYMSDLFKTILKPPILISMGWQRNSKSLKLDFEQL